MLYSGGIAPTETASGWYCSGEGLVQYTLPLLQKNNIDGGKLQVVFTPTFFTEKLALHQGESYNKMVLITRDGTLLTHSGASLSILEEKALQKLLAEPASTEPAYPAREHGSFLCRLQLKQDPSGTWLGEVSVPPVTPALLQEYDRAIRTGFVACKSGPPRRRRKGRRTPPKTT